MCKPAYLGMITLIKLKILSPIRKGISEPVPYINNKGALIIIILW